MAEAFATLGGGCFWCLEAPLAQLTGVHDITSGYAGGHTDNPTYQQVCDGNSGHAEVVRIRFDPEVLDFRKLLLAFFAIHDPTTPNRQGQDIGTQYRSVIYYHTADQAAEAQALIDELNGAGIWTDAIVTALEPLPIFWPAEEYHQNYFSRNPHQPYCLAVVGPKMEKLRKYFASHLKET